MKGFTEGTKEAWDSVTSNGERGFYFTPARNLRPILSQHVVQEMLNGWDEEGLLRYGGEW